jgi:hypothetical protein
MFIYIYLSICNQGTPGYGYQPNVYHQNSQPSYGYHQHSQPSVQQVDVDQKSSSQGRSGHENWIDNHSIYKYTEFITPL